MTTSTSTKPAPATKAAPKPEPKTAVEAVIEVAAKTVGYLPASDSTPDRKEQATKLGQVILDLVDGEGFCYCGCKTPKAKGSRFVPGHDAKLKGKLVRATLNDVKLRIVIGKDEQEITPRRFAEVLATPKYNWATGLDEAVAKAKENEKAAEARRVESAKKAAERRAASGKGAAKLSLADFAK